MHPPNSDVNKHADDIEDIGNIASDANRAAGDYAAQRHDTYSISGRSIIHMPNLQRQVKVTLVHASPPDSRVKVALDLIQPILKAEEMPIMR